MATYTFKVAGASPFVRRSSLGSHYIADTKIQRIAIAGHTAFLIEGALEF